MPHISLYNMKDSRTERRTDEETFKYRKIMLLQLTHKKHQRDIMAHNVSGPQKQTKKQNKTKQKQTNKKKTPKNKQKKQNKTKQKEREGGKRR